MTNSISLQQLVKQSASLKQTQRLMMSPQMQQAINLLQMPVLELSVSLEEELQQNPVIEFIEEENEHEEPQEEQDSVPEQELSFHEQDFEILKKLAEDFHDNFHDMRDFSTHRTAEEEKLKTFQENSIISEYSLFEYLMQQAKETFPEEELAIAEALIGNFDENGYLKTPLQEISILYGFSTEHLIKVLKKIQDFEPYGVGASSMQESLLIQLRCRQKDKTLAYKIIDEHYDDLLHNRIPLIKKNLDCSPDEITYALKKDISHLDLHPGLGYFQHTVQHIIPDAKIELEDTTLSIKINDDFIPSVRINRRYLKMLDDETLSPDTKDFIRQKLTSAKWLFRTVHQRNETLLKILELLIDIQKDFFLDPEGQLTPLVMKVLAEKLGLHESTIARTVANKYIDTPRGLLALRSFFTSALESHEGDDISSSTIRQLLQEIIESEDKRHPYSDAALSKLLEEKGIQCARRTVAKYRSELHLGNTQQRRKY